MPMKDLYTRFNTELTEKAEDARKLFAYLADSYFGTDVDLGRIRVVYREFLDLKTYYVGKNNSIKLAKERAWREDYQNSTVMEQYLNHQINPFIEMLQFIIELYEENLSSKGN